MNANYAGLLAGAVIGIQAICAISDDDLQGSRLDDGRVLLENGAIQAIFDPADAGGAASLFFK